MVALAAAQHRQRLEVRRLEHHRRRRVGDLGVLAAHHAGETDRPLGVGDHEVVGSELAACAVERDELLPGARAADDDPAAGERLSVVRVQRAAEREHHVVRDVDDVRDRAHPRADQPCLQPRRRLADRHVAQNARDEARARFEVVDRDLDSLVALARGPPDVPGIGFNSPPVSAATSRAMP